MKPDLYKNLGENNNKKTTKVRVDKKRLFFVFLGVFVIFFFVFTFIGSSLTPSIDVPAINESDEAVPSFGSNDFRGRIDPRLNEIEMNEDSPTPAFSSPTSNGYSGSSGIPSKRPSVQGKAPQQVIYDEPIDGYSSQDGGDTVPYNNGRNSDVLSPDALQSHVRSEQPQRPPKPATVKRTTPAATPQDQNIELRDKVDENAPPVPISSLDKNKVIVGNCANPEKAEALADSLIETNPNLSPFIIERNGKYVLQVGSFSNLKKAQAFSNELQKYNIASQVIQD